jgi:hypothetical protein
MEVSTCSLHTLWFSRCWGVMEGIILPGLNPSHTSRGRCEIPTAVINTSVSAWLGMAGIAGFCWSRPLALELKRGGVGPDMNPRQILQGRHVMNTSGHGGILNCSTQEEHAVQSRAPAEVHLQTVAKDTYLTSTSINTGSESKRWTRRAFQTWGHTKTSVISNQTDRE